MEDQSRSGLTFVRVFDAPRELVWKAWTDPEMIKKWWGPKDFTSPVAKIDFKVGGKYLLAMHGPKGTEFDKDLWSTGVYKEIVPMEKIVVTDSFADEKGNIVPPTQYGMPSTFPTEATIIITFEELTDNKTKMTVHYPSAEGIEGEMLKNMTQGWNQSIDKLVAILK